MSQIWQWITGGIAHLVGAFKVAAAMLVTRVLAAFGLSLVSFKTVLPQLKAFVLGMVSGMPAEALNFLAAIGVGEAMSMVFSALTVYVGSKVFIMPTQVADALKNGGLAS